MKTVENENSSSRQKTCDESFAENGPYWHLYTLGKEAPIIFTNEEDYRFMMNLVCQATISAEGLKLYAFAIMSNHIHMILSTSQLKAATFFELIRKRLSGYLKRRNRQLPPVFRINLKRIQDLKTMRNSIVYVHRNGYVVNPGHTPFSYPWGTGRHYFNPFPFDLRNDMISTDERRKMFHGRAPSLPADYLITDGYVVPSSYCDVELGMSMFYNAHQYFSMVSKNVEAYSELATEMDDDEFLTDSEMYSVLLKILKDKYGQHSVKDLSRSQKIDVARSLRFEWKSSNEQIRRMMGLTQYEVDSLFPLSAVKNVR